jgi:hypothetical protein
MLETATRRRSGRSMGNGRVISGSRSGSYPMAADNAQFTGAPPAAAAAVNSSEYPLSGPFQ